MRALDLFCGAGGATRGLQTAGFHVTGVDIRPQPRYCGDRFIEGDALTVPLDTYDFIWASPPCQAYSHGTTWRRNQGVKYPDLIDSVRDRLIDSGVPYCIENVVGARRHLRSPFMLCGAMFGLGVIRHRVFETSSLILVPFHQCHKNIDADLVTVTKHGPPARWYKRIRERGKVRQFDIKIWHEAMGIDWMPRDRLTQAIPPAYSEFIARQFLDSCRDQN